MLSAIAAPLISLQFVNGGSNKLIKAAASTVKSSPPIATTSTELGAESMGSQSDTATADIGPDSEPATGNDDDDDDSDDADSDAALNDAAAFASALLYPMISGYTLFIDRGLSPGW